MKKLPLLILIGMGSIIIKLKVLDQLFTRVVASAVLAVVLAISLTSSCVGRLGTRTRPPLGFAFEARPTFLCEGEEVDLRWDYRPPFRPRDTFTILVTRRPGGLLEIPLPHPPQGSSSFLPRQPSLPGEVAETAITFTATLRAPSGSVVRLNTKTATALVIGSTATQPHVMVFEWGCDNARDRSAGWSSVDYQPGEIASERVLITSVRNLNPFSIIVGVGRRGFQPPVGPIILGVGVDTDAFNGELYGAWGAAPLASDSYGLDGCEEGVDAGGIIVSGPGGEPTVVLPRPEVLIEFTLACQVL